MAQLNVQTMDRTELELRDADKPLAALRIHSECCCRPSWPRSAPIRRFTSDSGQRVFGPEDRLKTLKSQLASYKAKYAPGHPDIVSTQREVDGLEKEIQSEDSTADRLRQLSEAKGKLAGALEKYSADHPDVVRLQHVVRWTGESRRRRSRGRPSADRGQTRRQSGLYPSKGAARCAGSGSCQCREEARRAARESRRIRKAPGPGSGSRTSISHHVAGTGSAQFKYQEVLSKQTEVQVSQNLEPSAKARNSR